MSAEPQQEDAHADPAIEIQLSIISDVVNDDSSRQSETLSPQNVYKREHSFCVANCFSFRVWKVIVAVKNVNLSQRNVTI
jgi:hypothetical protein